jgi:hypothetical protein
MQARPAWSLQFNLGIVQGEKLVNVASLVEEFDPSTCDCDVLLRHRQISIFKGPPPGKLGRILTALSVLVVRRPAPWTGTLGCASVLTSELTEAKLADPNGAFMEPSGRNQWQPVANATAAKTPKSSQIRCHGLRPVAPEP